MIGAVSGGAPAGGGGGEGGALWPGTRGGGTRAAEDVAAGGADEEREGVVSGTWTSVMWQIGHSPGRSETICGCIGQMY